MERLSSRSGLPQQLLLLEVIIIMPMVIMTTMTGVVWGQSDMRNPASITKPLVSDTKYERNGSVVTLKCQASGTPPPTYEWHFNGARVTTLNPPGGNTKYNETSGDLVIKEVTSKQTGYYRCRASNSFVSSDGQTITITDMSPKIQVLLAYVDGWPQVPKGEVRGSVGQYLALKCDDNVPDYAGPTEFKWYLLSNDKSSEVFPDKRIFIDLQGTLHFSYLLEEDNESNLPYSCALSNVLFGSIVMGRRLALTVDPGNLRETGPTLQYPGNNDRRYHLNVTRGSPAQLECFFSGYKSPNESPSVVWTDNGNKPIVDGEKYVLKNEGRILEIRNVDEVDEGPYFCQGRMGSQESEGIKIMLNVTSPPIWRQRLQSQTLPEGRNAVFHCDTRSMRGENDPGRPLWYRNGDLLHREIGEENPRQVLSNNNRTLTVSNVQKNSDIACYQCVVHNSVGETFGSACLNVLLPIQIITRPEPEQIVSRGDRINLTVVATSDPLYPLTYEWIFKNLSYKNDDTPPLVHYDSVTKVAYLNTSGLNDEQMKNISGLYRRRVYHPFQHVTVDVMVKLKSEMGPAAAGFQYWIIGLILALLLILIVLIICCCVVCRRKMQEGDYPVDKKETAAGLDPEKEMKEGGFPDLSRAQDPYQKKPGEGDIEGASVRDDESFGSSDYGLEPTAFTEDGSFIGVYKNKDKTPVENPAFNHTDPTSRENPRYNNNNNDDDAPRPPRNLPRYNNVTAPQGEEELPRYNPRRAQQEEDEEEEREMPRYNPYTPRRGQEEEREIPRYQNVPSPTRGSPRYPNGQPWVNPSFDPNESAV